MRPHRIESSGAIGQRTGKPRAVGSIRSTRDWVHDASNCRMCESKDATSIDAEKRILRPGSRDVATYKRHTAIRTYSLNRGLVSVRAHSRNICHHVGGIEFSEAVQSTIGLYQFFSGSLWLLQLAQLDTPVLSRCRDTCNSVQFLFGACAILLCQRYRPLIYDKKLFDESCTVKSFQQPVFSRHVDHRAENFTVKGNQSIKATIY